MLTTHGSFSDLHVSELVGLGRQATEGALANPGILDGISPPYDREALIEVRKDLLVLADAIKKQADAAAQASPLSAEVKAFRDELHTVSYLPQVEVAHRIFQKREATLQLLGPVASRAEVFQTWAMHVRQFYLVVVSDADLTSEMAEAGLSEAELTVAFSTFEKLVAKARESSSWTERASQSRRDCESLAADFRDWLYTFGNFARLRLDGSPEWLASLGCAV